MPLNPIKQPKKIKLKSPDGLVTKTYEIKDRVKGYNWSDDPTQKEIASLLSKGWKKVGNNSSSGNGKGKQDPYMQRMLNTVPDLGNGSSIGDEFLTEEIDVNMEDLKEIVDAIAMFQRRGNGKHRKEVGHGIQVVKTMQAMKNELDFLPYLKWKRKVKISKILISIDTSPSTSKFSGMTKSIAKALARHPNMALDYDENFNGFSYNAKTNKAIEKKQYDLIIYIGDSDFFGSIMDDPEQRVIAIMQMHRWDTEAKIDSNDKRFAYKCDITYENIYYAIIEARDYFRDNLY